MSGGLGYALAVCSVNVSLARIDAAQPNTQHRRVENKPTLHGVIGSVAQKQAAYLE